MAVDGKTVEVGKISIKVTPDTSDMRRTLVRELEQIERTLEAIVNVSADTRGFRQEIAAATRGLEADVKLNVDRSAVDQIRDQLRDIKPPTFGSGGGGSSFGAMTPSALAVALAGLPALAPLLSGALGAATTGILALPGLISAVAVPIAALTLGVDGLKAAAAELAVPFGALKGLMSIEVANQFLPVFETLKGLFPTLERSLPSVTQGLADWAQAFSDAVTSPEGLEKLDGIIRDIGQGLSDAAPGIGDFTNGFLDLVKGFTGQLPDIAEWLNTTGKSFSEWAADFTQEDWFGESKFSSALDGLGDTLQILGDGLVDIGGKALDFFSDPEKIKSFKTELDGLVATISTLVDLSNSLATNMSKIPGFADGEANGIMDFAPIQIQLIKEKLEGVDWSGIWAGLEQSAASAFAGVVTTAGTLWSQVVSTVAAKGAEVVTEVGSLPSKIVGALGDLGGLLVGAGQALMTGLLNGVKARVQAVYDFVSGIAGRIAELKGPLPYDRKVLVPNGEALMEGLGTGIENGLSPVLDQVKGLADQLSEAFGSADFSVGGLSKQELKEQLDMADALLSREAKELDIQIRKLDIAARKTDDEGEKERLKAEADGLRLRKDDIALQRDEIDLADEITGQFEDRSSIYEELGKKMFEGPLNMIESIAGSTGQQFLSDLGVGGQGAISQALQQGLGFAKQFVFNVGSLDEAIAVKNNQLNKDALQYNRR